jgi:hypothetical protein
MAFRNTNKIDLVEAVMRFYQHRFSLPADSVFPVLNALTPPPFPAGGQFYVGIAVGDGRFVLEEEDDEQLREDCAFTAIGYTRMQADWGRRADKFLLNRTRGGLAIQGKMLLIVGTELTDLNGDGLIASRVYAQGTVAPNYDQAQQIGWSGIRFGIEFDWDLPEAADLGDD